MSTSRLMNKYRLCTDEHDPFLDEKAIWIAHLSSGDCVFQDDDRPGITDEVVGISDAHSAWVRLFHYLLAEQKCTITMIRLKFRDHVIRLPHKDISGYYFTRGIMSEWGSPDDVHYNVMGVIRDVNQLHIQRLWYHLPSIEVLQQDELEQENWCPPNIIWNLATQRLEYGQILEQKVKI